MAEFSEILTHGRRLQGAVKNLSIEELEAAAEKLQMVIIKRKKQAEEQKQKQREKLEKVALIKKQMLEAGLDISDLQDGLFTGSSSKKSKKRPVKYRLKDSDGKVHDWTGIGRTPVVFRKAIEDGHKLDDFAI